MKGSLFFWTGILLFLASCRNNPAKHRDDQIPGASSDTAENLGAPPETEDDYPRKMAVVSLRLRGSASFEEFLSQTWTFEDADRPHWHEIFHDSASNTNMDPQLTLFSDHMVTEDARCPPGHLRLGKWRLNKNTRKLQLTYTDGSSKTFVIRKFSPKSLELGWDKGDGDLADITCTCKEEFVYMHPVSDPFHPLNLQWRIKPKKAETDDQLRRRVGGFVHFFALFFWDTYVKGNKDIDFNELPNCFVWYNGGIGMQSKSDLDKRWIGCFYSGDQALRAYDMLGDILESHVLKWPEHPTSWIKQTAQVLDQMAEKVK
jgi:hypothetical protein